MSHTQGLTPALPVVATPNSVLSEEAFKGLKDLFALDSGDEEEDVNKEVVGEGSSGDKDNLVITNLGLLQPLVDSLFKHGITHLFLIQTTWGRCLAKDQVALTVRSGMNMPIMHDSDLYKLVWDIGSGNFGIARLMRDKQSKELVAVKYIEHGEKIAEASEYYTIQRDYFNSNTFAYCYGVCFWWRAFRAYMQCWAIQ